MEIVIFFFLVLIQLKKSNVYGFNIINDNHFIKAPLQDQLCNDFINPIINSINILDKEYTIQSPNYPNNYPPNIDCVNILKAPKPEMVIVLEFRETFQIEESDKCNNDFLQINDGPFGFSKMIIKLCGKEIGREMIQSSGHYLWLRFYSDNTLTNRGFKFVYRFQYPDKNVEPAQICYKRIIIPSGHSVSVSGDKIKNYRNTNNFRYIEECIFDISVHEKNNIFISITSRNNTGIISPGQFIEVYDRITTPIKIDKYKNFFLINENFNIEKIFLKYQRAVLRISFKNIDSIMMFQIVLTALFKKPIGNCSNSEYKCGGSYCISNGLVCNNLRNCPNGDDEICSEGILSKNKIVKASVFITESIASKGKTEEPSEKDHIQLHGLILGSISLLLVFMLIGCIIHSVRQSKKHSEKSNTCKTNDVSHNVRSVYKFENKLSKPTASSTATLTTDVLSKKNFLQSKNKTSNKQNLSGKESISDFYRENYCESIEPHSMSYPYSRDSCSPNFEKYSKSISSLNKYRNHGSSEHLPGCTSLPNFSTESVKNLFEDENYPVIEEITISKPVRMKYYV